MSKSTPIAQLPQQVVTTPTDVTGDDDATIQEVLSQITGASSTQPPQPSVATPPPATMFPAQVSPMMNHMQQHHQNTAMNIDPATAMLLNNLLQQQNAPKANILDGMVKLVTDDFKIGAMILVGYLVVHFIPVSNVLGKYLTLEKIPYADIVIKAVILAACVLLARRFVMGDTN